jgi:hypothetical protein
VDAAGARPHDAGDECEGSDRNCQGANLPHWAAPIAARAAAWRYLRGTTKKGQTFYNKPRHSAYRNDADVERSGKKCHDCSPTRMDRVCRLIGSGGDQKKQGGQSATLNDAPNEIERRRISPMHIFERKHHRLSSGSGHYQIGEGC